MNDQSLGESRYQQSNVESTLVPLIDEPTTTNQMGRSISDFQNRVLILNKAVSSLKEKPELRTFASVAKAVQGIRTLPPTYSFMSIHPSQKIYVKPDAIPKLIQQTSVPDIAREPARLQTKRPATFKAEGVSKDVLGLPPSNSSMSFHSGQTIHMKPDVPEIPQQSVPEISEPEDPDMLRRKRKMIARAVEKIPESKRYTEALHPPSKRPKTKLAEFNSAIKNVVVPEKSPPPVVGEPVCTVAYPRAPPGYIWVKVRTPATTKASRDRNVVPDLVPVRRGTLAEMMQSRLNARHLAFARMDPQLHSLALHNPHLHADLLDYYQRGSPF